MYYTRIRILADNPRPFTSRPSSTHHLFPKVSLLRSALAALPTPVDDLSTGSSDYAANSWVTWFLSTKGNEYFCEVDEDYILDRFNLTGLNAEVQNYPQALDLITDALEEDFVDDDNREHLEAQARLLYGLIHARFIITSRGLAKMLEKYKRADFGRCPRVLCYQQPLLPVGLSDLPFEKAVKLYCPRCEDIYSPKSSRHGTIDGAYFGTSFPHMLFMVYPHVLPPKTVGGAGIVPLPGGSTTNNGNAASSASSGPGNPAPAPIAGAGGAQGAGGGAFASGPGGASSYATSTATAAAKVERYRPRVFGFPVHEIAKLQRWQEAQRDAQVGRLEKAEQEGGGATA